MIPFLRSLYTAVRGRARCNMSMCGRPVRTLGYCNRHLNAYHYTGREAS